MKTINKRIRPSGLLVKNQLMLFMVLLFAALPGCVRGQQSGESKSDIDVVEKAIRTFEAEQEKRIDEEKLKADKAAELAKQTEELDNDGLIQLAQLYIDAEEYDLAIGTIERVDFKECNRTHASKLSEMLETYGKACFEAAKVEGKRSYRHFLFNKATDAFEQLIDMHPLDPKYHALLAKVQLKYRPRSRAIESYRKAIELAPNSAKYYISRAWYNEESRKEDLSKAATLEPKNYKISYLRAFDARDAKDFSEALKQIDISLRHKPESKTHLSDLISLRGEVFAHLQDYNKSIDNYRQFLRLNPGNVTGLLKYAKALENARRYSDAVQTYDELEKTIGNPSWNDDGQNFWAVYLQRGYAHKELGNAEEMLADFKRAKVFNKEIASKVDPEIAKAEQAIRLANLETAIQEEPSNPQNYLDRGIERRKQKRYRDSVTDIQKAIAIEQSNSTFHYQLGITQTWIDHKLAIPSYTKAIQLDGKNWCAYKERANSYRRLQEFDKAIADCTKIIDALQDEPEAQLYKRKLHSPLLTAYRQRGYLKRLNGESPMPNYEAAKKMNYNTKDWIRNYEVRKATDSLEFDLPLEKEPRASELLVARGVKAWEYLRRNLSRRHGKYFDEEMAVDVIRFAKWDLERAIEIDPENELAHRTLGQILVYHPYDFMWEKGTEYLFRAADINPSVQNHWSLASAYHQIAKTKEGTTAEFYLEEAEKAYESILEINPEHAGTKRRLADLRGQKYVADKTVKEQVRDFEEVWKVETQMQINRWRKQHGMVPIGIK